MYIYRAYLIYGHELEDKEHLEFSLMVHATVYFNVSAYFTVLIPKNVYDYE